MKKVIVTTTINPPTKAVKLFQAMTDWELVVIGDLKTPKDYHLERGVYMVPPSQEKYDPALSDAIGWNCIQRRNFGLLLAHDMKADIVAVVDDDNIPLPGWGENLFVGQEVEVNYYETDLPAFDPVGATNYTELWHRGYPLQLLSKRITPKEPARACASTCRPISGTAIRTSMPFAAWSTRPNAISIQRVPHRGQQAVAVQFAEHLPRRRCASGLFSVSARRADGRHLGLLLRAGQKASAWSTARPRSSRSATCTTWCATCGRNISATRTT